MNTARAHASTAALRSQLINATNQKKITALEQQIKKEKKQYKEAEERRKQ